MLSSKLTISSALLDVKDDVRLTRLYLAQAWNKLRKASQGLTCARYTSNTFAKILQQLFPSLYR